MELHKCRSVWGAFGVAIALALPGGASAQGFPARPLSLVVPFAAGGPADVVGRLLGQRLAGSLGQAVVVDNRAGAGGTIGAGVVAKATPDGHTLLFVTAGHAGTGALYSGLPYDPVRDFAPVIGIADVPIVIAVSAASRFRTLQDLVAEARARPGKLNCAGGGGGATVTNLAFEAIKAELRLDIGAVPYKGSAPAVTALIAGEIDCDSDNLGGLLGQIAAGKLRALAVTTAKRSASLPQVPTVAESVVTGFEASAWFGILAPRATPTAVIDRLNREFGAALADPGVQERMKAMAAEPKGGTPAEFGRFLESETVRWSALIRRLNLKAD
ncbi:MAG: tripartite tricarboxylate transporter substrate binding protein [Burkholderiales bacterium]|nr:tripartite tricarboxylate transporter substrate binding protein [Burkholderiales bacterium]